jgi:hypothetical protein
MSVEDNSVAKEILSASDRMKISVIAQDPKISTITDLEEKADELNWNENERNFAIKQRFSSEETSLHGITTPFTKTSTSGFFSEYMTHLISNKWNKETVRKIGENVEETYERMTYKHSQIGKKDRAGYGLVVGRIQSGKTAHMLGLCMRAMDVTLHPQGEEYNTVILLSGLLESLRNQTFSRLKKADIPGISILPEKSDFAEKNQEAKEEFAAALLSTKPCILVIKKNHTVLEAIIEYLADSEIMIQLDERRILILDDECDHASIDSSHSEQESLAEQGKITATNRAVRGLIRHCDPSKNTRWYVGYTATPYSNLLMHPEPEYLAKSILGPSLFPRDMIHCLPKPDEHKDNEFFFNGNAEPYIEVFETPPQDSGYERKHLRNLVLLHIISKLLRANKNEDDKPIMAHTTMIHTDTALDEHLRIAEIIRPIVEEYQTIDDTDLYNQINGCAAKHYPQHLKAIAEIISYYKTSPFLQIQNLFTDTEIVVLNSDKPDADAEYEYPKELNYSLEHEVSLIVVGGHKLARGLTLEGLTVSWFARASKKPNYDTLLQMARWCGFRGGYSDYIRIFMNKETVVHFQLITEVERRLRTDLRKFTKKTNPLDEIQWIREYKGLSISGRLPKNLTTNPSESKSIAPEFMLEQLPENFTKKPAKTVQKTVFEAFLDIESTYAGEERRVHGEFDLYDAQWGFIKPFFEAYLAVYGKPCESKKYLEHLLIEIEESESFADWNLVIHRNPSGRSLQGWNVSNLGFTQKKNTILRYPKVLPIVDFETGQTSRQKPMLCIFLEDPSHSIVGNPVYEDNEIPIVMIGFFLPPQSISAAFIEMARPGADISVGEEE